MPQHDCCGVLVLIRETITGDAHTSWAQGDYEGLLATVISVFGTGSDRYQSRALVRILDGEDKQIEVPLKYLVPARPTKTKQDVLILRGLYKGSVARVREECGDGLWFVSVGNEHFEIESGDVVVLLSGRTL